MDSLILDPIRRVHGNIVLPGSKSLSNRALLLAALSTGDTLLENLLHSDDVRHMRQALSLLGVELIEKEKGLLVVGQGGIPPRSKDSTTLKLFLGNAGTAMRPLTAALCAVSGTFTLTGEARMEERPIGDLVDALRAWGAKVSYGKSEGFPPLNIEGGFLRGGKTSVRGNVSSQFLSSLLMVAPLCKDDAFIEVDDLLVSKPYVDLTLALMECFGIRVKHSEYKSFRISAKQNYSSPGKYFVEGDASSGSYFLAAAAVRGGKIRVTGAGKNSVQGDARFAKELERMGAKVRIADHWIEVERAAPLKGIESDMVSMPDAAMTLASVALFAEGPTTITGIGNWRVKETDRIAAMAKELGKVGALVETFDDGMKISPPKEIRSATIETYDDHRMAMSMSLAAMGNGEITILDPGCTSKTFPDFFEILNSISKS